MKPSDIFIPLNFFLSLSTALLTWGVRIRKDKHDGFCSDPWGADWYVPWFISSVLYAISLLYAVVRGKRRYVEDMGNFHGPMFVFTWVFTFVLFVMGFLYFSEPDDRCDSLQVFDSILWALGVIGGLVLVRSYPTTNKAVIPLNFPVQQGGKFTGAGNFKNLRY
jgi:hypothetical protein